MHGHMELESITTKPKWVKQHIMIIILYCYYKIGKRKEI